jgi:hypothetical protein
MHGEKEATMRFAISSFVASLWLFVAGGPVAADEVWDSDLGTVVYEKDLGDWAVWSFEDSAGGNPGRIFLEGLAGVFSGRGSYSGYWMIYDEAEGPCTESQPDIEGGESHNYGTIELTFLDPDFPSRWRAQWGVCDEAPSQEWTGTPRVGN